MLSRAYKSTLLNGLETRLVFLVANINIHHVPKFQRAFSVLVPSNSRRHLILQSTDPATHPVSNRCRHSRIRLPSFIIHHNQCLFRAFCTISASSSIYSPFKRKPQDHTYSPWRVFISKCHSASKNVELNPNTTSFMNGNVRSDDTRSLFEFAKTYAVNHFSEPNKSWNDAISQARVVSKYDMDLYQRMMTDLMLSKFLDYRKLEENKTFQEFVSHYFRTYNYQITGLITIMFTKLFLYSKHLLPESLGISKITCTNSSKPTELDDAKLESDIVKLAECFDMVSYGYYFHDTISHLDINTYERSLRNLLLLLGDYFLVKSSYDVASFSRIDLYKIYVQTVSKFSEGESLYLDDNNSDSDLNPSKTYSDNPEVEKDFYLNNDQSESCFVQVPPSFLASADSKSIHKLINYCYLTSGHMVASSLQSAFYLANFNSKAQMLAFEFGKNIGMAIKISNQLSAQFVSKLTNDKVDFINVHTHSHQLPVNHLNLSYFSKFPSISIEVMQFLLSEYINRAIRLLGSLIDPQALEHDQSTKHDGVLSSISNNRQLSEIITNVQSKVIMSGRGGLSDRSVALLEGLIRVINEIQCFNKHNIRAHSDKFTK